MGQSDDAGALPLRIPAVDASLPARDGGEIEQIAQVGELRFPG